MDPQFEFPVFIDILSLLCRIRLNLVYAISVLALVSWSEWPRQCRKGYFFLFVSTVHCCECLSPLVIKLPL